MSNIEYMRGCYEHDRQRWFKGSFEEYREEWEEGGRRPVAPPQYRESEKHIPRR